MAKEAEDPDVFCITREQHKRKKRRSPKKVSKDIIHERLSRFLDGFEVDLEETSEEELGSSERGEVKEEDKPAALNTNV